MRCNEDQAIKKIVVSPGAEAVGDLATSGALRFERRGGSMAGRSVMCIEDGMLALHYADGASVYVKN